MHLGVVRENQFRGYRVRGYQVQETRVRLGIPAWPVKVPLIKDN